MKLNQIPRGADGRNGAAWSSLLAACMVTVAAVVVVVVMMMMVTMTTPAHAQAWPAKPVRLIVSYPAGGGLDITARLLAPKLADALGQPVTIENRGGSGGVIGGDAAAKAAPDGYTFLFDASSHGVNPALQAKMPFDTLKDLVPVTLLLRVPNVLVINPALKFDSVKALIADIKAKPGQYSYASSGNGSAQHLAAELFKAQAGLFMVHIPYRGGAPAIIDVMGGQVPMFFGNLASASSHIKSGKVRALAVTGNARSPSMPQLPTIAESGLPGYEVYEWNAVFAPAGVPGEIIERLQRELVKALALPDVRERLAGLGAEVAGGTPAELESFRRSELTKWAAIIKRAGLKAD